MKIFSIAFFVILLLGCTNPEENNRSFLSKENWQIDPTPVVSAVASPDWLRWQTDPCVLKVGGEWLMYFGCNNEGVMTQIGRGTSTDGVHWTLDDGAPTVQVGPAGAWDDADVETPWVIYDPDAPAGKLFQMWYSGKGAAGDNRPDFAYQVGYAFSADGKTWEKYNDSSNDADSRFAESDPVLPIPIFIDDGEGGFAPSDLSIPYDAWTTAEPSVVRESSGTLQMYYIGLGVDESPTEYEHRVAMATSQNGYEWSKQGVVFECNHSTYEKVGITCCAVAASGSSYILAFTMFDLDFSQFANIERGYTGFAISSDGSAFERVSLEPVIGHGPADSFYMSGAFAATPVIADNDLFVYFSGLYYTEAPAAIEFSIGRARNTKY